MAFGKYSVQGFTLLAISVWAALALEGLALKSENAMQVGLLRSKFDEALGERARQLVDVSTIDGFQVFSQDSALLVPHSCFWLTLPVCHHFHVAGSGACIDCHA